MTTAKLHGNKYRLLKTWDLQGLETLLPIRIYWLCTPVSAKANRFSASLITNTSLTLQWVVGYKTSEKQTLLMAFFFLKWQNLSESDWENEAKEFFGFIVLESLKETCLVKLSPFLIETVISTWATPRTVKKTKNGNLLVEVHSWRYSENILKMNTFHKTKCKAYPHEKLKTLKGVIRGRELSLATPEEITVALGKQGSQTTKDKRKVGQEIQTNTYIGTFCQLKIPKEIKIGYSFEKVEQWIPAPLRCFKCQRYSHHRKDCRGHQKCGRSD